MLSHGHFLRGFVANGTPHGKYDQYYSYAYNPCRWISLAGECDRDKETAVSNSPVISAVIEMELDVFGGFVVLEKSGYLSLICKQQLSIVHWDTQEDLLVINRRKKLRDAWPSYYAGDQQLLKEHLSSIMERLAN